MVDMYLENLFELVRQEKVVLWAGAGISIYSGLPSGAELKSHLINTLSQSEKLAINSELPLPNLAEEIYRIKGNSKNFLIERLREVFVDFDPISINTHLELAQIPHIKTIITTNYDSLFENAYRNKGQVVYASKHLAYLDASKTQIFKVHGDLSDPDSIILTNSDYERFFMNGVENDIMWRVVSERLATNHIVFLGYNLEDPNVSIIFDRISSELGDNRKDSFLIAPNLPQHKINNLIKKNIKYIDSTGEDFITKLLVNIKDNILSDFDDGLVSSESFRAFLSQNNIYPELMANEDKYELKSLRGGNGKIDGKLSFGYNNNENEIKRFLDIAQGKSIGSAIATNVDLRISELKLPNHGGEATFTIKSKPRIDTVIDFRFMDGTEFDEIRIKVYTAISKAKIEGIFKNALLTLDCNTDNLPNINIDYKYDHNDFCGKISEEIEFFKFLHQITQGNKFTIYTEDKQQHTSSLPEIIPLRDEASMFLEHFQNLKSIEIFFNMHFRKIKFTEITDIDFESARHLNSIINNQIQIKELDGLVELGYNRSELNVDLLSQAKDPAAPLEISFIELETINLYGYEFDLGEKSIEIVDPIITNIEEVVSGKAQSIEVRSQSNKIKYEYTRIGECRVVSENDQ